MGYYQGLGGRLIVQTDFVPAKVQAAPVVTPGIGTVTCPWSPTLTLNITKDWLPGCYLLKLVGDGGEEQFVPLTIRDDASTAAYVLQNSVTTWQAYNLWGSYSLYYGPDSKGRADVRRPRPRRVLRPALPADVGVGRGRLRRQRAAAALPPREPRAGHDLLDRRRPARPAAAPHEPPLPLQPGPRRVLVHAHAPGGGRGQRRRRQPGLPRRQRLLPPDPPAADLGRPQSAAGLLQGRRRGPDRAGAAGAHHGQLEPGAGQRSRVDPHRLHVPVGRGQGRHGGHRRVVVVLRRLQPHRRPRLPHRHPRRVRPLRPLSPRPAERRRAGPLARARPGQLVRHHLLHGARQRRRRAGQRLGQFVSLLGTTGAIPPNVDRPGHSRGDRRHPPGHGERLRPLRPGSGHARTAPPAATGRTCTPAPPPAPGTAAGTPSA